MRAGTLALCASLASSAAPLEDGPEDKLLQGELLEVSTGDLEKAMAIYRAIEADEKAPEAARARALLYLARCQRKRGELDAARKTLDGIVKAHAKEGDVVRQARSFLKELEGGRAENTDFDWLKDLAKSPEIQARVFDLAMDLASTDSSKAYSSARQLRALGAAAVPVIERVLEVSRDPTQRQRLAIVLLYSGRHERLGLVLDPAHDPNGPTVTGAFVELLNAIPAFGEEHRRELIAALDKLPASPETAAHRSLMRLLAGDRRDVPALLRGMDPVLSLKAFGPMEGVGRAAISAIERLAAEGPAAARALAERLKDPACPFQVERRIAEVLHEKAPAELGLEHWVTFLERCRTEDAKSDGEKTLSFWLEGLEKEGSFEIFERLAMGPAGERIATEFRGRYGGPADPRIFKASPRWAKILRAAKAWRSLHLLAEANDEAIPEFVDLIKNREREAPEYRGVDPEYSPPGHAAGRNNTPWEPSPAYVQAMAGFLDAKDLLVQAIAIEAIAQAPASAAPDAFERIARLARESSDDHIREFALYALILRFSVEPEAGPAAAAALVAEFDRRSALKEAPESYRTSPLASVHSLGNTGRPLSEVEPTRPGRLLRPGFHQRIQPPRGTAAPPPPPPAEKRMPFAATLEWLWGAAHRQALYPHVLAVSDSAAGARFHGWVYPGLDKQARQGILFRQLEKIQSPELMEATAGILRGDLNRTFDRDQFKPTGPEAEQAEAIAAFFQRAAADSRLSVETRTGAFFWAPASAYGSLDWPKLFAGGDPLAVSVLEGKDLPLPGGSFAATGRFREWVDTLSESRRDEILKAGLASPGERIRGAILRILPLDRADLLEVFRAALKDPSQLVRSAAVERLGHATRADAGPLYVELLGHADSSVRMSAVARIPAFASPECIEPLTRMLDDPDVEVRAKALEALKKIKGALEEKREWQDLVRRLREEKPAAEKPK